MNDSSVKLVVTCSRYSRTFCLGYLFLGHVDLSAERADECLASLLEVREIKSKFEHVVQPSPPSDL